MLNYTEVMTHLVRDIVATCPEFAHIDVNSLLISYSQARVSGPSGQFAKIAPMRFEGGSTTKVIGRRRYQMPKLVKDGREILYIIYFCMPKFQNLDLRQKLVTVFHELYHISPQFDGDVRRFPGRNYAHGRSRAAYNETVAKLVDAYLAKRQGSPVLEFLTVDFAELERRNGGVMGAKVRQPRPVWVAG